MMRTRTRRSTTRRTRTRRTRTRRTRTRRTRTRLPKTRRERTRRARTRRARTRRKNEAPGDEAPDGEADEDEAPENEALENEAPDDERSETASDDERDPQRSVYEAFAKRVHDANAEFRTREALAHLAPSPIRFLHFRPGDYEHIQVLPDNMCYLGWQAIVYDRQQMFNAGKSWYFARDLAYYAQMQNKLWYRISRESIDHIFAADPQRGRTEEVSIVDLLSDIGRGYLMIMRGTKGLSSKPGKFLKARDGDSRRRPVRADSLSHPATALVPTPLGASPLEDVWTDVVRSCEGGGDACGSVMCVVGACQIALKCKFPKIVG